MMFNPSRMDICRVVKDSLRKNSDIPRLKHTCDQPGANQCQAFMGACYEIHNFFIPLTPQRIRQYIREHHGCHVSVPTPGCLPKVLRADPFQFLGFGVQLLPTDRVTGGNRLSLYVRGCAGFKIHEQICSATAPYGPWAFVLYHSQTRCHPITQPAHAIPKDCVPSTPEYSVRI